MLEVCTGQGFMQHTKQVVLVSHTPNAPEDRAMHELVCITAKPINDLMIVSYISSQMF